MERFLRWPVFVGHIKGITRGRPWYSQTVLPVLLIIFGGPTLVGLISYWRCLSLQQPASLLTALAILAGGSLTAFTHVSTLRLRLTDREDAYLVSEDADRKSVDEGATHLLMSVVASVVAAGVIVFAMNTTPVNQPLPVVSTGIILALSTYVGILYLIAVPRLYTAYVALNGVSRELAGNLKNLN